MRKDKKHNNDEYRNGETAPFAPAADGSDDDLELSELLEKYMLNPEDQTPLSTDNDGHAASEDNIELVAEDIDSALYSEFASEVFSDENAREAAADGAQILDDFELVAQTDDDSGPQFEIPDIDGEIADVGELSLSDEEFADVITQLYDSADSSGADGIAEASGLDDLSGASELPNLSELSELSGVSELSGLSDGAGDTEAAMEFDSGTGEPSGDAAGEEATDFVDYEAQDEPIEIDENVDSTDINLMLAFGLDDELERTMGAENAQRLTMELDEEQRIRDEKVRKTVDNEYVNRSQTAGIAREYKSRYTGAKIKLALGAIFAIALFLYENLSLFKLEFTGAFDSTVYPTVYIMGSLQLLLLVAACAYDQLFTGLARLFTGKPDARSVSAVATVAAIVYNSVLCRVTVLAHKPLVVNFSVALMIFFTLVDELYNVRREIYTFNVVSSKRPKHVITKVNIPEGSDLSTIDGDILKFESASFIDGYFTRTKEPTRASKSYAVAAIVIALCSAAIAGVYTHMTVAGTSAGSIIENSFCGFFIALPVSMLICASYPFLCAARDAYDNDGAIIGECSLEEYSDAGCVTFDDVGVFPSYGVRVQNVKVYNNHRIDRVLYYAASVFSAARGPLTDVFDMATMEIGHSDDIKIKAAGSGYLSASVDGKNITFGAAAELITRGFDIPEAITDEDDFDEADVSVMYMFREERLMAKMFIRYSLDADFETIMSALCDEGISVSIKTYDPNIDNDLIASGLKKQGEYSYSVTRYDGADDAYAVADSVDSGIVSRSSAKTLLQLISECTKVLASRRAGTVIGIISSVVAAILMVIVIASGRVGSLTSGVMAIYQLFWLIPAYISARMYVR